MSRGSDRARAAGRRRSTIAESTIEIWRQNLHDPFVHRALPRRFTSKSVMELALQPLYRGTLTWAGLFTLRQRLGDVLLAKSSEANPPAGKAEVSAEEAAWLERFWAGDKAVIEQVYKEHADAVLAASIFHYGQHTVGEAKEFLAAHGLEMRR